MQRKINKPIIIIMILIIVFSFSMFSNLSSSDKTLDQKTKQETIDKISTILTNKYVFPEVAIEMAKLIKTKMETGDYDEIENMTEFAKQLTNDLQSISHDKHLRVNIISKHSPDFSSINQQTPGNNDYGFREVKILKGNIGYIDLRGFQAGKTASKAGEEAMKKVSDVDALIIDLRKNGGGSPDMIRTLTSYFFDGSEPIHLNTFYWRPTDSYQKFYTNTDINGKRMDDVDLYILTSKRTFSAAEEFTYNLKNLKRATIVGETTGGGAHPGGTQQINQYFEMFVPEGRAINPITKTNWEGTGIQPDIEVKADDALDEVLRILNKI